MYWHSKQNDMFIKNSCSGKFVLKIKFVGILIRCRLNFKLSYNLNLIISIIADPQILFRSGSGSGLSVIFKISKIGKN